MPDYRLNIQSPVQPVSPVPTSNPLEGLAGGIQSGAQMGFQAQQAQAMRAQMQMEAQKNQIGLLNAAHETYKELADINPDHAFDYYKQVVAPLHQAFLGQYGVNMDMANLNSKEETPDVIKQMNSYIDMAMQDPSKVPLALSGLQKISNATSTGKMMREKVTGSMRMLEEQQNQQRLQEMLGTRMSQFDQKQLANWAKETDPAQAVRNAYGQNQLRLQAAERIFPLVESTRGNPSQIETPELARTVATLISGGATAIIPESELKSFMPKSFKGNLMDWASFLTNQPIGRDQQAFVQRFVNLANREYDTMQRQYKSNVIRTSSGFEKYLTNPANSSMVSQALQSRGFTPDEVDQMTSGDFAGLANKYKFQRKSWEDIVGGLAPEDKQAVDWAKANPKDPRSQKILQLHGLTNGL